MQHLGFQAFGLSSFWPFRPLGFQAIGLLSLQAFRPFDLWAFGPFGFWAFGLLGYQGFGDFSVLGLWNFGPFEYYNFMKQNLKYWCRHDYPDYPSNALPGEKLLLEQKRLVCIMRFGGASNKRVNFWSWARLTKFFIYLLITKNPKAIIQEII